MNTATMEGAKEGEWESGREGGREGGRRSLQRPRWHCGTAVLTQLGA